MTTLDVDVQFPFGSVTTADEILIRASTPMEVFSDAGHTIASTVSLSGTTISLEIVSSYDPTTIAAQVILPLDATGSLGPLAAGTYEVHATWQHVNDPSLSLPFPWGPDAGLLQGAPSSGTGAMSFTVAAPLGSGDFNDDQYVDGADFLSWQRSVGIAHDGSAAVLLGAGDLTVWKRDFGANVDSSAATVPETPTAMLAVAGLLAAFFIRLASAANK